jgi:GNAT superfamily N-acetyltransferase
MVIEANQNGFTISTDKTKLDIPLIHDYLCNQSYWLRGVPLSRVKKSIECSLCFGIYAGTQQVGFARLVTDMATFAYLCDVFVLEVWRGKGLSKWLMQTMLTNPALKDIRRWSLATRDAHGLYAQFGFTPLSDPDRFMEIKNVEGYKNPVVE